MTELKCHRPWCHIAKDCWLFPLAKSADLQKFTKVKGKEKAEFNETFARLIDEKP